MKKIIAITALACVLVACGSKTVYVVDTLPGEDTTDTEAPETTVKKVTTTDAPVVTQPPVTWNDEDEFLFDVNNNYPGYIALQDQDMIDTGYVVCQSLRTGSSAYDVLSAIQSSAGGDPDIEELLSTIVAAAVVNFCPEQQWKFN